MRLSPSIFTFAQPLATVCLSQSISNSFSSNSSNRAADKVIEMEGTGSPADGVAFAEFGNVGKSGGSEDSDTRNSLDHPKQLADYCQNRNQAARLYPQRKPYTPIKERPIPQEEQINIEKTEPVMPETLANPINSTNDWRTRFT